MTIVFYICERNEWHRLPNCPFDGVENPHYNAILSAEDTLRKAGAEVSRENLKRVGLPGHVVRRLVVLDIEEPVPEAILIGGVGVDGDWRPY